MKVHVDLDVCIASGTCQLECPEVFDGDDDGYPVVVTSQPSSMLASSVRAAADLCPTGAITVEE